MATLLPVEPARSSGGGGGAGGAAGGSSGQWQHDRPSPGARR